MFTVWIVRSCRYSVRQVPGYSAQAGHDQHDLYKNIVERVLPQLSFGSYFKKKPVNEGGSDKEIGKTGGDPGKGTANGRDDKRQKDPNRAKDGPLFSSEHDEGLLADKPVSLNCEEVAQGCSDEREEKNAPTGVRHAA